MNMQKYSSHFFVLVILFSTFSMTAQFPTTTVQDAAQVSQPSSSLISIDEVSVRSQSAPVKKAKKKVKIKRVKKAVDAHIRQAHQSSDVAVEAQEIIQEPAEPESVPEPMGETEPAQAEVVEADEEEEATDVQPAAEQEETAPALPENAYLVDKIKAVVFAPDGTKVITKSELDRPGLDGRSRTLDDLILERLLLLDALKFKMIPDDETIDKYLANIQRENNLTLDALKKIFTAAGYSYEEGREQFGMMSIVNQILDYKIRSRLIVPEKEVVAYYNTNPETVEATYFIERAVVPYVLGKTHEQQQKEIELFINHGIGLLQIEWQAPYWMAHSEFASDKMFIVALQPGQISMPQETIEGFELFRVKEMKPTHDRPLEERYRDIVEVLRKPKYEQLMEEYKKQLFDTAAVLTFN